MDTFTLVRYVTTFHTLHEARKNAAEEKAVIAALRDGAALTGYSIADGERIYSSLRETLQEIMKELLE